MNEKCFGLRKGRECAVLEKGFCHGNYDTCPFYKPNLPEQSRSVSMRVRQNGVRYRIDADHGHTEITKED